MDVDGLKAIEKLENVIRVLTISINKLNEEKQAQYAKLSEILENMRKQNELITKEIVDINDLVAKVKK
jgi:flagellar capping protein FliD